MRITISLLFIFTFFQAQAQEVELLSSEDASCTKAELAPKLKEAAIASCQEIHQSENVDQFDISIEEVELNTDLCSEDGNYEQVIVYFGRVEFLCHY